MPRNRNLLPEPAALMRDDSGAAAVLFATALPPLIGVAALCVDMGSLYLAERTLQNLADASAAAALGHDDGEFARSAVDDLIADSGLDAVSVHAFETGTYARDPELHWSERFAADEAQNTAARVVLQQQVPLFFASVLVDDSATIVSAAATAARSDMAGFMLGSRVVAPDGPLANALLSGLAGAELGLTPQNVATLSGNAINLLDFAEAVASRSAEPVDSFNQAMDQPIALHEAIEAMADASGNATLAALLRDIAAEAIGDEVVPADLIQLGSLGAGDVNDGQSGGAVDAFSLLRSLLQAAQGDAYDVAIDADVLGLADVSVRLVSGQGEERSPWVTLDAAGELTLRTAQTRLLIDARTAPIAGLPSALRVPLYVELAPAEASMTDIVCAGDDESSGVYVDAVPSIGTVALASVSADDFADLSAPVWLEQATLINLPLIRARAFSELAFGGETVAAIHFTPEEIAAPETKTVGTTDALEQAAQSVVEDVEINVQVGGLGLGGATYTRLVGTALTGIAPSLDTLVGSLTDILGVKLGAADVTVDRLRCGVPTIVG